MSRIRSALAVLTLALAACSSRDDTIESLRGVKFAPAQPKTDFTLDDTQGHPFHFGAETKNKVALLYFGYTNCPDVCPVQLSNIANALKKLTPKQQADVR